MSILDPTYSNNILLSQEAKNRLRTLGFSYETFDELVGSMIDVLEVKKKLTTLEESISQLSGKGLASEAKTFGLKSGSVQAEKLATKKVTYKREGDKFTYNFDDIIKGIPSEMTYVTSSVNVVGAKGARAAGGGNAGILDIPGGSPTAVMEINIQTPKGAITLSGSLLVPTGDEEGTLLLANTKDFTEGGSGLVVDDHLELLSAEVVAIKQKLGLS